MGVNKIYKAVVLLLVVRVGEGTQLGDNKAWAECQLVEDQADTRERRPDPPHIFIGRICHVFCILGLRLFQHSELFSRDQYKTWST